MSILHLYYRISLAYFFQIAHSSFSFLHVHSYYARKLMDLHWVFLDTCSLVCGTSSSSGGDQGEGSQAPYEDPFLLAQADAVLAAGPKNSTASKDALAAAMARVVGHLRDEGEINRRKASFAGVLNRRSECQTLPVSADLLSCY